jgi:hypothetical protein
LKNPPTHKLHPKVQSATNDVQKTQKELQAIFVLCSFEHMQDVLKLNAPLFLDNTHPYPEKSKRRFVEFIGVVFWRALVLR